MLTGKADMQNKSFTTTDSTSAPPLMLEAYEIMQRMRVNGC